MAQAYLSSVRLTRSILIVALLLLAGCAGRNDQSLLPDLATLTPEPKRIEHLVIESGDQHTEMLGVLQHDQTELRMALFSPQGQRLLTLVQDGEGARFLPDALFKPPFSAHWFASRLAWALWPATQLQDHFAGSAWSVRQEDTGHSVYHHQNRVARISLHAHCTLIDDLQADHRVYIIPIEFAQQNKEHICPAH